jgi:hypothetical protein
LIAGWIGTVFIPGVKVDRTARLLFVQKVISVVLNMEYEVSYLRISPR